ncbi:tRNA pseudouridine synthase A [Myxococcaceae bacterium]|jgi:tRNA pseudouridine38-40 synthase|nr:tRNA pseudouridine synthase A [Myxococcaceae bacterium]
MATFRLVVEYDGSDFGGWQAQAEGARRTVQGTLEEAFARITGEAVSVIGAGRTDARVHAEGQLASVRIETDLDPGTLQRALNAVLPDDVSVKRLESARPGYHALRDARGKCYRYSVWNGTVRSPLRRRTHLWLRAPLDLEAMRRAAAPLVGRHDFAAFETRGREHPDPGRSTVRSLWRIGIEGRPGDAIHLDFEGEGFLRYMVRTLVGTLLEVGRGSRDESDPTRILESRDRRRAGPTAPPEGLRLLRVDD